LRTAIKRRCNAVAKIQGSNLSRPNVLLVAEAVGGVELRAVTATGIDNAPSDPKGAVLSLEQSVLVGVTDFVVARARQELVDYLLNDFHQKLCNPKAQFRRQAGKGPIQVDMTQIFPKSCALLGSAGTDLDLSQFGSSFELALKQDVQNFPQFFLNAVESGAYCVTSGCEQTAKIATQIYMAVEASRVGGNPLLAMATAAEGLEGCDEKGAKCGIRFLGFALETFAAQYKTLQDLDLQNSDDVAALADFLALNLIVLEGQDPKVADFLKDLASLRQTLQVIVPPVRQIVSDVEALQKRRLSKDQKADLSLEIVENLAMLWSLGLPEATADRAKLVNIAQDVHDLWKAEQAGQYDRLMADLFSLTQELGVRFPLPESVQRYLPLITALTTAQKPEDVTAALEKYAEPVGSWRDKQTGRRLLTLNAFAGGVIGATRSTSSGGDHSDRLALFVPVGFDYNVNRHFGLFFSAIDLGNLAEVRFNQSKNNDTSIPDVHLKEVVSPGLWLRYHVTNAPLDLGVGASLRRQIGTAEAAADTVWQFGFFVAVDVPLFSLYRGGGD